MKLGWPHGTKTDFLGQAGISAPGQIYTTDDTGELAVGDGVTEIGALDLMSPGAGGVSTVNALSGVVQLYVTPEKHANLVVTTAGEDDWGDAIRACFAEAHWVQLKEGKTYGFSGTIAPGVGGYLIGRGHQDADTSTMSRLKCLTSSAQIKTSGTGVSMQDVCIDGNSIATLPWLVGDTAATAVGASHTYRNVFVTGGVGGNAVIARLQNSHFDSVNFGATTAGPSCTLEWGCGGLKFTRCEFSGSVGGPMMYLTTGGTTGPYPYPEHITFDTCIFEYRGDQGPCVVADTRLTSILFDHCGWSGPTDHTYVGELFNLTGTTRHVVFKDSNINLIGGATGQTFLKIHGVDTSTFPNATFAGDTNAGANSGQALIDCDANSIVRLQGIVDGLVNDAGSTTKLQTTGSTLSNIYKKRQVYEYVVLGNSPGATILAYSLTSDSAGIYRYEQFANGNQSWGPGGSSALDCSLNRSGTGAMTFGNDLYADRFLRPTNAIVLSSNSSVTLDLSLSDKHLIYLNGHNLTGLSFSNSIDNQIFDVLIQQSASPGTIVLPVTAGNVLWTGGDANVPTAPGASGVMSFRLTTVTSGTFFIELSRSQQPRATTQTVITASGTYTVPKGAVALDVAVIGAGGGGGAGYRGAAGTVRAGGGGGGSGAYARQMIPVASLGATVAVTVGTGGAGGTAASADNTSGGAGGAGGGSSFGSAVSTFGATGGAAGGLAAAGAGGTGGFSITNGANGTASLATGNTPTGGTAFYTGMGGAGGGVNAANADHAGGAGGASVSWGGVTGAAGGTGGAVVGGAGGVGQNSGVNGPGTGGAGGGSNLAGAAGAGGAGGTYGGGGGGGGGGLNGFAGGAGGAGAGGVIVVTELY